MERKIVKIVFLILVPDPLSLLYKRFVKIVKVSFENVCWLAYKTSRLYKNAYVYNVYYRCLCFIFDQATMAQEQKSLSSLFLISKTYKVYYQ